MRAPRASLAQCSTLCAYRRGGTGSEEEATAAPTTRPSPSPPHPTSPVLGDNIAAKGAQHRALGGGLKGEEVGGDHHFACRERGASTKRGVPALQQLSRHRPQLCEGVHNKGTLLLLYTTKGVL